MAYSYTRQSTISDGDTITAALFNNEFNQLLAAFNNSTGHKHDGTTAEGPVIGLIGDAGETSPNNKVLIDTSNNHIEFYVEVSSSSVQQLRIQDGAIVPITDSDVDLGTSSLYFKDAFIDSITTTGNVSVGGNLDVTGTIDFSDSAITNVGSIQLDSIAGDADSDTSITFSGSDVITVAAGGANQVTFTDGAIVPSTDNDIDLGSSSSEFKDLFINGTANIDSLVADTADINGGTVDGAIIGGSSAAAITGTTITGTSFVIGSADISEAELETIDGVTAGTVAASKAVVVDSNKDIASFRNVTLTGELDAGSLDISGDADIDGTLEADAITVNGATLNEVITDAVGSMVSSNTETGISVTFEDGDNTLDFVLGSSQTTISSLLNTSLVIGRDADNDIDFATDNNIIFRAAGEDQIKLQDGALVPVTNNDIDLGTSSLEFKDAFFDGTVTADAFAGPLTGNVTGNVSGTAATVTGAAQSNITSLGTLTTLTVDNVIINGTTIGHTDDTDLMTLADGVLTVAGEVDAVSLDVSGDVDIDGTLEADAITVNGVTLAETISDTVGAMVSSNTETNITVSYDDSDNTLDFVIGSTSITNAMLAGSIADSKLSTISTADKVAGGAIQIDSGTDGTSITIADSDDFAISDAGTEKKVNASQISTYVQGTISGDITISGGTAAIGSGVIVNADINSSAAIADSKLDTISTAGKVSLSALEIDGGTDIGAALTTSDLIVVDDGAGGTNRKAALSRLVTLMESEIDAIGGNLTITGNLTVNGSTTTVSTTNTVVSDKLLELANGQTGTPSGDIGLVMERGSSDNAFIGFDESADKFIVGTGSFTGSSTGDLTVTTGTLVANVEGNVTGNVTGNVSGTAATVTGAAQSNITSVGTLTTLTVDNVIVNGTTIGHTDDTDLITLADGIATVAGELSVTTLDIGGTNVTSTAAELNILDGVTSTAAELNILDGVTTTATELNIMDGDTSATSTTLVDADRVVVNDAGTMKQVAFSDVTTFINANANFGESGFTNTTMKVLPGNVDFDLAKSNNTGSVETPFDSSATDAFGVGVGFVFDMQEPVGSSTDDNTDLGTSESHVGA